MATGPAPERRGSGRYAGAAMVGPLLTLLAVLGGSQVLKAYDYFSPWREQQQMYKLDIGWPKTPEHFTGQTFCVAVDSLHGLVYVGQRGDNVPKVLVFSVEGYFLYSWNETVEMPHGMFVWNTATDSSVWITDVGTGKYGHTVKQYNPLGKLMQVLGTPGNAGSSLIPLQFDQPAEVFVEESGDMYVVDGDGGMNNRVLKLSDDYKEIWLSGTNGTGIGQFKIPHSVTVDAFGRVWVADRDNKRIQVFDKVTGEWLGSWSRCFSEDGPYSVRHCKERCSLSEKADLLTALERPPLKHSWPLGSLRKVARYCETRAALQNTHVRSSVSHLLLPVLFLFCIKTESPSVMMAAL
ncbi:NHL repeat-containing protein 3 isoform X1 [Pithys albifrons albifrons]|uniref:NHL repeat-containing protein 3 isoform X1 n=1 Tax=Pithys albifrons albifrons TaxID=3385563 RepID=UPI003A5CE6E3